MTLMMSAPATETDGTSLEAPMGTTHYYGISMSDSFDIMRQRQDAGRVAGVKSAILAPVAQCQSGHLKRVKGCVGCDIAARHARIARRSSKGGRR